MDTKGRRKTGAAAWLLVGLLCLAGCGRTDALPPSEGSTTPSQAQLFLGEQAVPPDTRELTLSALDFQALTALLPELPHLETVCLEGPLPAAEDLLALRQAYPALSVTYQVPIAGREIPGHTAALDLTGAQVTGEELAWAIPYLCQLEELTLLQTPLTDDELRELTDRFPEVFIRCQLPLGQGRFSTDETAIDLSGTPITREEVEEQLPYFPRLERLDLSFCGLDNEVLDQLNRQFPQTRILWTVSVGMVKVRTDDVFFYPAGQNYYPSNKEMENLRYCPDMIAVDIGHTPASDCQWLAYMPHVKYLILADTNITDISPVANLKELVYLELFNLRITDYSPLLSCTALQDLNIGTTHADPAPLSQMTWLHNLQWHRADQDPQTREAVLRLPEQLPETNVILWPKKKARNIGGPWRYLPNYYIFRDIIGASYFNQDQIHDYWGQEDGDAILASSQDDTFVGPTLARILRRRIDSGQPVLGTLDLPREKAEALYQSLLEMEPYVAGVLTDES